MKVLLGVHDVPEPYGGSAFDAATALEKNYGLFTAFFETHREAFVAALEERYEETLQALFDGSQRGQTGHGDAMAELTTQFKQWINSGAAESDTRPYASLRIPTGAAVAGLVYRKSRVKTGKRRPSFIYSGIMVAALQVWMEKS